MLMKHALVRLEKKAKLGFDIIEKKTFFKKREDSNEKQSWF